MGSLFGGAKKAIQNNPLQEQAQAIYSAQSQVTQNVALENEQNNYQQVSRLGKRRTSSGNTPVISSGGFFGAGGRQGGVGSDRRNTFLGS